MTLLRDRRADFEAAGVGVYALSRDHPWSHAAWSLALDLDFPLLSDWEGEAVRGFGLGQTFEGLDDIATRSAFLVDTDGVVRAAFAYDTYEVPDLEPPLAAARALTGT